MIRAPSRLVAILSPWWGQRTPRERVLLAAMVVAALGYLGFAAVARPMLAARAGALQSIARSDMALARLATAPDAALPAVSSDQPVSAVVTETATEFGLAIRRIEPEADGARLTIHDAAFDDVLRWIEALETRHGLQVVAVRMDRGPEPGTVGADLTVRR